MRNEQAAQLGSKLAEDITDLLYEATAQAVLAGMPRHEAMLVMSTFATSPIIGSLAEACGRAEPTHSTIDRFQRDLLNLVYEMPSQSALN